jgi:putative DeoR family transcriptional regulator, stage III sporulation protein D
MRGFPRIFLFCPHIYGTKWGNEEELGSMKDYIRKRVLDISQHILDSKHTVRQTAQVFGVSKSTVHKDVTERLPTINKRLASKVKNILDLNKSERHIRGGEATRKKYKETIEI